MPKQADVDKAVLMVAFAKMDVVALAVAVGFTCALVFFLATVALVLKGAPPGVSVGPNLGLFSIYLPGYSVSWAGGLIGSAYALVIGAVIGAVMAILWNLTHYIYIILLVIRANWWRMMVD